MQRVSVDDGHVFTREKSSRFRRIRATERIRLQSRDGRFIRMEAHHSNGGGASLTGSGVRNKRDTKTRARIDWRASLVPAPAEIPAPIAYILKLLQLKSSSSDFDRPCSGRGTPFAVSIDRVGLAR